MAKINELVQQGTRFELLEMVIPATYDDEGNVIEEETVKKVLAEVPNMVEVYREIELEDMPEVDMPITIDERMDAIEDALVELAEILTEGA